MKFFLFQIREPEQEDEMFNLPTIDMVKTGQNIMRLRIQNGFSVKELQDILVIDTDFQLKLGA